MVFAGYGLSVPGKAGEGYNSYAALDVTNKIVLVLRYVPEGVEPTRRQELNRYAALRYKAMIAREHGAKALLVVTGPASPNGGALVQVTCNEHGIGSAFTWSPDGESIAHVMDGSVCITDARTGRTKRLTEKQFGQSPRPEACVFSPDGAKIACVFTIDGFNQVFVVDRA